MLRIPRFLLEEDDGGGEGGSEGTGESTSKAYSEEEFIRERDKAVTQALKTREDNIRKELADKYKDTEAKLKTIEESLETERKQREDAETKASFIMNATKNEVVDPETAFLLVQANEDFKKKDGSVDWKRLKEEKSYLFKGESSSSAASTHAGSGKGKKTQQKEGVSGEMNSLIRQTAGY